MNSTIRRCKMCGNIFSSYGSDTCPECAEEMDRIFNLVQDYIYEHENATVVEISKALEVDGKIILGFIRDGSLALNEGSYALDCERCRKPIPSGKYCNECKAALEKMLGSMSSHDSQDKQKETKKRARMHISLDK